VRIRRVRALFAALIVGLAIEKYRCMMDMSDRQPMRRLKPVALIRSMGVLYFAESASC
jgi:hypothetical protein